jgi:hypothetical protein
MTVTLRNLGVDLGKASDHCPLPYQSQSQTAKPRLPWYPIMGHREGLRMNDLITLHSAFVIIGYHGGTAHVSEIPGTTRSDGTVVPFQGN